MTAGGGGVTGTLALEDRAEGKRLLEDAKAAKLDLVLIYKLDRLGRSARVTLNAVYDLEQHGIKIRSMTEPFDTGDPSGRFLLTILAGVAALERETIIERMWHGANRAAKAGRWLGGIVPFGYLVNDEGYLEVSNGPLPGLEMSEADVIRLIYQMSAERGLSCIAIADYLNAIGVPPSYSNYSKDGRQIKKGKRKESTAGIWRPSRIRNVIANSTYKGVHEYGKRASREREIIRREVPAIVNEETWEKAQQTLKDNQIEAVRNAKRQYLLRGLVKCGGCGSNYTGVQYSGKGGQATAYYRCNGKQRYRGPEAQSGMVVAAGIEDDTWAATLKYFIRENGQAVLRAANPEYADMPVTGKHRIIGHLVGVLKDAPPYQEYKALLTSKTATDQAWAETIEIATQFGLDGERVAHMIKLFAQVSKQV